MNNILQDFFYALGFKVDEASVRRAKAAPDEVASAVEVAESRATKATVQGAAKRIIETNRERGVRTKGAAAHIADLKRQQAAEAKAAKASAEARETETTANKRAAQSHEDRTAAFVKGSLAMVAAIQAAAVGITAAVDNIASGLERAYYTSKRTNSSVKDLKAFAYAAEQLGVSSETAIQSVEALAKNMRDSPGYETMLKNLGVQTRDANGDLIGTVKLIEELKRAFTEQPRHQANSFANAMGLHEDLVRMLRSNEVDKLTKEYNDSLAKMGVDPDKAAAGAVVFENAMRRMFAAIDGLKIRIGGAVFDKFSAQIERFTKYLHDNADQITKSVINIGETLLRLAKRVVDLVEAFTRLDPGTRSFVLQMAAIAGALLFLKSGPVAALLALSAAIVVLYDDYKKWREGSTDNLVDWDKWAPAVENLLAALKSLWEGFDRAAKALTGQDGLTVAFAAFAVVLTAKVLAPLGKVVGLLGSLGSMRPPGWMLALLGVGVAAKVANDNGILDGGAGSRSWHESILRTLDPGIADRIYGQTSQDAARGPNIVSRGLGWVKEKVGLGGDPAGGGTSRIGKLAQNGNARAMMEELSAAGYSDEAIAAMLGSAQTESTFNPRARNEVAGGHTGLFQWDKNRWPKIKKWIEDQGGDPYDARWQTKGAIAELDAKPGDPLYDSRRTEKAGKILRNPRDLDHAMEGIREFERYGVGEEGNRGAHARGWLPIVKGKPEEGGAVERGHHPLGGQGRLSSRFGMRRHPKTGEMKHHNGIDLAAPEGTDVQAMRDGIVSINREGDVTVRHPDGSSSTYRHIVPSVRNGDAVKGGGQIGKIGPTDGRSTGPHLHLELRDKDGNLVDPQSSLERKQSAASPEVDAAVDRLKRVALDTAGKVEQTLIAYPRAWMDQAETSLGKGPSRLDAVDNWRRRPAFETAPLGAGGTSAGKTIIDNRVFNEGTRTTTVNGVSEPKTAADQVIGAENRQRSNMIGQFQNRYA